MVVIMQCPECGSEMILRQTNKFKYKNGEPRKFYGCSKWPNCKGTHGADPQGNPLGIPGDHETKKMRIKAHDIFESLWKTKSTFLTKGEAYNWLAGRMGIANIDCHIGRFDKEQCEKVIKLCEKGIQ